MRCLNAKALNQFRNDHRSVVVEKPDPEDPLRFRGDE